MAKQAIGRREFLMGAGAGLAMTTLNHWGTRQAKAAGQLLVLDSGGPWQAAAKAAFYDDFERETGIKVVYAAGQTMGAAQLRAMVNAGRAEWDVINLKMSDLLDVGSQGLLEPVDYKIVKTDGYMPEAAEEYAFAIYATATIMAYNHEKFSSGRTPKTWADFWDVKRFPGRRGMANRPYPQLEAALLADGVSLDKLYPLDVERALRKLDELKPHVLWWTSLPQQTQFMLNREVDIMSGLNARLLTAIENGAPYTLVWSQGFLSLGGWGVPKGAPNKAAAMKFLAHSARPKAQAMFAKYMAYGPVNGQAYAFISADRAKVLPTYPDNVKQMTKVDEVWWAKNVRFGEEKWVEWRVK